MLKAEHICVRYGARTVVSDVSLHLSAGQWLMLAGPNGAGKSSLVGAIAGHVKRSGSVLLHGRDIHAYTSAQRARKLGVLAQKNTVSYAYTVEEVVSLGRYAYSHGFLTGHDGDKQEKIDRALELTGLAALRRQSVLTLSGGELQRTFLAQVFAQDPEILILDEPANHLDLAFQSQVFSLIDAWRQAPGRAVISVVHDLSLARKYGTHALLMHEGRCMAQGETNAVLTRENLSHVYGMDVHEHMIDLLGVWAGAPSN